MLTYTESIIGGVYAGTATTAVWYLNSMVAGHSNMFGHVFRGDVENKHLFARRVMYIIGLFVAGIILTYGMTLGGLTTQPILAVPWWFYLIGGLLLGFGTQIAGGCTLGGLPFGSTRSILSFLTFFILAFVINNWAHGGWKFISEGGSTGVATPVGLAGGTIGMLIGVYFIGIALLAIAAVLKKRVNAILGSLMVMLVSAIMFGIGFGLGGMLQQSKTLGALDLSVQWDFSVWIFAAVSLFVACVGVQIVRNSGFFSTDEPPESVAVTDFWLIIGAAMVGISFGLCGLTIGTAITMIPKMFVDGESAYRLAIFLASTIVGVWIHFGLSRAAVKGKEIE